MASDMEDFPAKVVLAIIEATIKAVTRHMRRPTAEEIQAEIMSEVVSGKKTISEWFAEKGLEQPK